MKKLILILLIGISTYGQNHVTLNVSQDAKLLFAGDEERYDAGTLDLTFRSEWQGNQQNNGYMFIAPEFEYAILKEPYKRYSVNVGYTFNKWIDKVDFTSSLGYGIIHHYKGYTGFSANFQISHEILKGLKVFIDLELIDRKDLTIWKEIDFIERVKISGKFGVKVDLK